MIKSSTYIRSFTPEQRKQLEEVASTKGFKTVPEILFYALEQHLEQNKEIERLKRIIEYKQKKIEKLNNEN
ncbi:hypothetical protein V3471_00640 [Flavobacterium oreochromis]|uniref:hypothetical protein n=1 Tax=Flavobacterium TaxID=237 RepID=UPI000B4D2ECF|nr:hypothetical protein [Flavobacterium covae]OWP87856.1 hypothetical protein BWK60_01500 [Flavobacterium covae]POR25384.1 hypothetical protein BWK58_06550 [Flavobacterium columnare]